MSPTFQLLILTAACACITTSDAAGFPNPLEAQSKQLLKLNEDVQEGNRISADQVFAAYKEYVSLYKLQEKLASGAKNNAADSDKYEAVSRVLGQYGIDDLADNLFSPFYGNEPGSEMTKKQRNEVLKAIQEM